MTRKKAYGAAGSVSNLIAVASRSLPDFFIIKEVDRAPRLPESSIHRVIIATPSSSKRALLRLSQKYRQSTVGEQSVAFCATSFHQTFPLTIS